SRGGAVDGGARLERELRRQHRGLCRRGEAGRAGRVRGASRPAWSGVPRGRGGHGPGGTGAARRGPPRRRGRGGGGAGAVAAGARVESGVGRVYLHAAGADGALARMLDLPGERAQVRARATVTALHLIRALLTGSRDEAA